MSVIDWLEISADYGCNNQCVGCFSVSDEGPSMSLRQVVETLAMGRSEGAKRFWMGGGEPTLRRDLSRIIGAARRLGYTTVRLQTNGMMLAYPQYAARLAGAGLSEISVNIKGARAETHDRLARTPGCHARLVEGIAQARAHGIRVVADILAMKENMAEIPEMTRFYADRGVERFWIWLFSAAVELGPGEDLSAHIPRISELMPHISAAMDAAPEGSGPGFIKSLHTPACTIPAGYEGCRYFVRELRLMVADPGGRPFMVERSPVEGGHFEPGCEGCALWGRCNGIRPDYLKAYGAAEFRPIAKESEGA